MLCFAQSQRYVWQQSQCNDMFDYNHNMFDCNDNDMFHYNHNYMFDYNHNDTLQSQWYVWLQSQWYVWLQSQWYVSLQSQWLFTNIKKRRSMSEINMKHLFLKSSAILWYWTQTLDCDYEDLTFNSN